MIWLLTLLGLGVRFWKIGGGGVFKGLTVIDDLLRRPRW